MDPSKTQARPSTMSIFLYVSWKQGLNQTNKVFLTSISFQPWTKKTQIGLSGWILFILNYAVFELNGESNFPIKVKICWRKAKEIWDLIKMCCIFYLKEK